MALRDSIEYRDCILDALEILMADSNRRFSKVEEELKCDKWHLALIDITDEQVNFGLVKALRTPNAFMMDSGTFRELCLSDMGSSNIEEDAQKAWTLATSRLNGYATPVFKDTAITEAIRRMGGWKHLCSMLESEKPFRKKEFIENYKIARRTGKVFTCQLTGRHSGDKIYIGFESQEEIKEAAKQLEAAQKQESEFGNRLLGMMAKKGENSRLSASKLF